MTRLNIDTSSPSKSRRRQSSVYGQDSLEALEGSVQEYQEARGTPRSSNPTPSHEENNMLARLVRKRTNTNTDSETGSRISTQSRGSRTSREGSDGHHHKHPPPPSSSRALESTRTISDSRDARTLDRRPSNDVASAKNENDRFALRFNPEGINVKMQGGIEGRAIQLRKSREGGEGDMELMIEGPGASAYGGDGERGGGMRGRGGSGSRPSHAAMAASGALMPVVREREREGDGERNRERERERVSDKERERERERERGGERNRSHRRYSIIEGRVAQEILSSSSSSSPSYPSASGPSGPGGGNYEARNLSIARYQQQHGQGYGQDEGQPRVIGERIIMTTRSRSRRGSRYAAERERYGGGYGEGGYEGR